MKYTSKTHQLITEVREHKQGTGFRNHLGASIIGHVCPRVPWYIFRWARRAIFSARMLRLFDRGNNEEPVFIKMLRQSGVHVLDIDPQTKKQFRAVDHDEHFGGSYDAKLYGTPDFPAEWVLGEFKTHNDRSFKDLVKKGLKASKFQHYVQTQIYMYYAKLKHALYFAVNKNDDNLVIKTIEFDETVAEQYIDRARKIINARRPPTRISESPGWWQCQWCDFKEICHDSAPKAMNCRTCINAQPVHDGQWHCQEHDVMLDRNAQLAGCSKYHEIPE